MEYDLFCYKCSIKKNTPSATHRFICFPFPFQYARWVLYWGILAFHPELPDSLIYLTYWHSQLLLLSKAPFIQGCLQFRVFSCQVFSHVDELKVISARSGKIRCFKKLLNDEKITVAKIPIVFRNNYFMEILKIKLSPSKVWWNAIMKPF